MPSALDATASSQAGPPGFVTLGVVSTARGPQGTEAMSQMEEAGGVPKEAVGRPGTGSPWPATDAGEPVLTRESPSILVTTAP